MKTEPRPVSVEFTRLCAWVVGDDGTAIFAPDETAPITLGYGWRVRFANDARGPWRIAPDLFSAFARSEAVLLS